MELCLCFEHKLKSLFFQEFSPGSSGRMTTMGVYVRDLLLGQVRLNIQHAL